MIWIQLIKNTKRSLYCWKTGYVLGDLHPREVEYFLINIMLFYIKSNLKSIYFHGINNFWSYVCDPKKKRFIVLSLLQMALSSGIEPTIFVSRDHKLHFTAAPKSYQPENLELNIKTNIANVQFYLFMTIRVCQNVVFVIFAVSEQRVLMHLPTSYAHKLRVLIRRCEKSSMLLIITWKKNKNVLKHMQVYKTFIILIKL